MPKRHPRPLAACGYFLPLKPQPLRMRLIWGRPPLAARSARTDGVGATPADFCPTPEGGREKKLLATAKRPFRITWHPRYAIRP